MIIPKIVSEYSKVEYWDERYSKRKEQFDWYKSYSDLKNILSKYILKENKILNVGCGNSKLSEEMFLDGYSNIINIDFSSKVINLMNEKYNKKFPNLIFKHLNVFNMKDFNNEIFNIVLDKGTLDSVLSSQNPIDNCNKMISEIYRVLIKGGKYICISFGDLEHREKILKCEKWDNFIYEKIPKNQNENNKDFIDDEYYCFYYMYIMIK